MTNKKKEYDKSICLPIYHSEDFYWIETMNKSMESASIMKN
jgi:hypothetical protein